MDILKLINRDIFTQQSTQDFCLKFSSKKPIRHLVIDNFLDEDFATTISTHFPAMAEMNTHYHGLNEKKSEHSDFAKLDVSFSQLHAALSSDMFIECLQRITCIAGLETIDDRLGYGLHQGGNNSFLDIHIDYNLHPIKKKYRKLNFILFFNQQWRPEWGGHLELWDEKVESCVQSLSPVFNRCVIFECSDISYHGYNRIAVPDGITRKSYYQYYFIPVEDPVSFHDTIFKPRPEESLSKKILTLGKDFSKNSAKRILLALGWRKFLK